MAIPKKTEKQKAKEKANIEIANQLKEDFNKYSSEDLNTEEKALEVLMAHIKIAKFDKRYASDYNSLQLDLRALSGRLLITEVKLMKKLKALNSEKVNDLIEIIIEQRLLATIAENRGNNSFMKEFAEHSLNAWDKSQASHPDLIILKPTAEWLVTAKETLIEKANERYAYDKRTMKLEEKRAKKNGIL